MTQRSFFGMPRCKVADLRLLEARAAALVLAGTEASLAQVESGRRWLESPLKVQFVWKLRVRSQSRCRQAVEFGWYCMTRSCTGQRSLAKSTQLDLHITLETKPVEWNGRLCTTIIAVNEGLRVAELGRHWLRLYCTIEIPKLSLHVRYALSTDRAAIRAFGVFGETLVVYTVAAFHEYDRVRRSEHVFATDRTIALGRSFYAAMGLLDGYVDTNSARLEESIVGSHRGRRAAHTLQWKKSLPSPSPFRQIPQSWQ